MRRRCRRCWAGAARDRPAPGHRPGRHQDRDCRAGCRRRLRAARARAHAAGRLRGHLARHRRAGGAGREAPGRGGFAAGHWHSGQPVAADGPRAQRQFDGAERPAFAARPGKPAESPGAAGERRQLSGAVRSDRRRRRRRRRGVRRHPGHWRGRGRGGAWARAARVQWRGGRVGPQPPAARRCGRAGAALLVRSRGLPGAVLVRAGLGGRSCTCKRRGAGHRRHRDRRAHWRRHGRRQPGALRRAAGALAGAGHQPARPRRHRAGRRHEQRGRAV